MTRFYPFDEYGKFSVNDFINNGYQSFTMINRGEELNPENEVELTTTGYKTVNIRMKLSTFKNIQNHTLYRSATKDGWDQWEGEIMTEYANTGMFWSLEYLTASRFAIDYRSKMSIVKVFNDGTVLVETTLLVIQSVTLSDTSGIVAGLDSSGNSTGNYSFGDVETIGLKGNVYGFYWLLGSRNDIFNAISTYESNDLYYPYPTTTKVSTFYLIRFTGIVGKSYNNYKNEWR